MYFGVRAHDFGTHSLINLSSRLATTGAVWTQLAPPKALTPPHGDDRLLTPKLAGEVGQRLRDQNIRIAVLGCYVNFLHPDPVEAQAAARRFIRYLELAPRFGAHVVGTETGSIRADYGIDPANHGQAALAELTRRLEPIADAAARTGSLWALEAVSRHCVDSPARMQRLIRDLGSPQQRVILDTVNLLSPDTIGKAANLIQESLDRYGERISVLHVKDCQVKDNTVVTMPPGKGLLDWLPLVAVLRPLAGRVRAIVEEIDPAELPASLEYLRACGFSGLTADTID